MAVLSACLLACATTMTLPAHAQERTATARNANSSNTITLNFVNAEIEAVARAMANLTGRSVIVDPKVKGTITLLSDTPVSAATAYNQFLAALRLQGFTVVQSGEIDKVVPEGDAKLQTGVVSTAGSAGGSNQIQTQIFKLNFENANQVLNVLRPLISPNNTINVSPGTNTLVITDYADNLQRMARIIAALDTSSANNIEVLPLQHGLASDLAPLILKLADPASSTTNAPNAEAGQRLSIVAEPRSNALIVRAGNPAQTALVKSLVEKLDRPNAGPNGDSGNIWVVYLKNSDATKLAATLRGAISGGQSALTSTSTSTSTSSSSSTTIGTTGSTLATTSQIQADTATNSLIITAPEPQYRQLRAVIDKLDTRRAQVFVESLIIEVNADKSAEVGAQWQGLMGKIGDSAVGIGGTNFGSGGSNIVSLAAQSGGTVLPSKGLNLGIGNEYNGVYTLGFLARFLEQNASGNVLSTPNLLTLDNEEAKIVIGQNVPFVTGQYTNNNASSSSTVNPFQTIERKDVGLTLRVKPQVSENGTVKLTIYQEVSSVQASSINSTTGLITNKRSIESNVLVQDGGIIVLGGLLQDEYSNNEEKVPLLGDIPFLGALFRSDTRTRKKTNLMVFMRPVVMRDASSGDALTQSRYDLMRTIQGQVQGVPTVVLPNYDSPQIPEGPATGAAPAAAPGTSKPATATP
jgi:general secretion pathway protein D